MNWRRGFRRIAFVSAIFTAIVCAGLSIALVLLIHSNAQSNLRWEEKEQSAKEGQIRFTLDDLLKQTESKTSSPVSLTTEKRVIPDEQMERLVREEAKGAPKQNSNLSPEEEKELAELRAKESSARQESLSKIPTEELLRMRDEELKRREALSKERASAEARLEELQKGFWVSLSKGGLVGLCGAVGLVGGIIGFVIVWLIYKFLEWLVLGFCDNNRLQPEKT